MKTPKTIFLNFCLILVALSLMSGSAWAAMSANPSSVSFSYVAAAPDNVIAQDVQISGTTDISGVSCTQPAGLKATLFSGSKTSGTTVRIQVNPWQEFLATSYSGTCRVTGDASATVDIAVTFTVNNAASTTLTLTRTSLAFNAASAGSLPVPALSDIGISSGNTPVGFTISGYPSWLTVYPTSGTTTAGGIVYVQVQAQPLSVTGTQTGSITITPTGGTPQTVSVTYGVGVSTGALFASTSQGSTLNFTWATGQASPAAQQIYVQSNVGASAVYIYSNASWITPEANYKSLYSGTTTVNVNVNPADTSLQQGISNVGTITLQDTSNNYQTITVYFTVNGTGTGTLSALPSSLNFTYAPGSSYYPTQQTVTINGAGTNFTATAYSSGNWLSVTQSGSTLLVNVNPYNLTTSVYSGSIYIQSTALSPAQTLTIPVTLNVGSGGIGTGTVAGPNTLNFAMQQGGAAPASQTIAVAGTYGGTFTASVTQGSGGNWLVLNTTMGNTPGLIAANVVPPAGLAAGTYSATITVTSSYGTISIPVSLQVSATPIIRVEPGNIALNYQSGGMNPGVQAINLSKTGAAELGYTVSSGSSWLQVTPTAGSTPQTISMVITTTGLTPGINTGYITLSTPNAGNPTTTIPVTINVYGTSSLSVNPTSLTFNTSQGTSPASQTFTISTDVLTSYTAAVSSGGWLSVNPTSGSTPGTVTVQVASTTLAAGQYTGTVMVTANGQSQVIPVTLNVGAVVVGTINASPQSLVFDYVQGDAAPTAKGIQVTSSGGSLNFNATTATSTGSGWLSVSRSSGATPSEVNASVNPSALAPGTYNGTVTITSAGANGSPQVVSVTLNVRAAANLAVSQNLSQFTFRTDSAVPSGQTIRVTSTGADLGFTAASSAAWLSASPSNGTTPADVTVNVNPAGLATGRYTGTVTITSSGARASSQTIDVVLTVTAPLPTITRVVNAATGAEGPLAPGEVFTVFGTEMGPAERTNFSVDGTDHYATMLANVKVRVNGMLAPLVYVSATEARAIAPYRLSTAREANVQVDYQGSRSNSITVDAVAAVPGVFTVDGTGTGPAGALNQDGSANSAANAAERGTTITVFITGDGQSQPDGEDGKVNRGDANTSPKPILPVTATIDGLPANVTYAGGAPGQVAGMTQVKIEVPLTAGTGNVPLVIKTGTVSTQSGVTLAVK